MIENKKIKVLHYGLTYNQGGLENVVLSWFKNKPDNIQFDFVNDCGKPLAYQDIYENGGSKIINVTHRYTNVFKHYQELRKLINEGEYDYIHCHVMTLIEAEPAIIASKSKKCRAIYHCHSMYKGVKFPFKEIFLQKLTKVMLLGHDYLRVACSKDAGDFMYGNKPFTVIENGVDTNKYKYSQEARDEIRKKYNIGGNDIVIGHVGRIGPEKNYPFIIKSFFELSKENNNNYKLLFIGNADTDENIVKMVDDYRLKDKVIFAGVVLNVNEFYSAMDIFFLPSINEGFPLTLVEAQTSGLPCVTSTAVTKDTKITDNIEYINLDVADAKNALINVANKKINRDNVSIDLRYDIKNSSNKMFNYYRENRKN